MKCFLFSLCFFFFCLSANAQQIPVTINIYDSLGVVSYANIIIIAQKDTTQRIATLTDEHGKATIPLNKQTAYSIFVKAEAHADLKENFDTKDSASSFLYKLTVNEKKLNEVVVKATKPLMRQEDDKTVIDPEALVDMSTNGYEVLEKTPGLFIDQDGNIYISSSTPATVYINGRQMKLSPSDLAALLKGLPPNAIEKIEILRTPSSKYEASGSGGVVNVVLKKGIKIGITGQVYGGFQQGKYGNQYMGGSISNNNGTTTTYLNTSINNQNYYEELTSARYLNSDTSLNQFSKTKKHNNNGFIGYGINHEFSKKWKADFDGSFNFSKKKDNNQVANNFIAFNEDTLSNGYTYTKNPGSSFTSYQDASATYTFDTIGSQWTTDLNYMYATNGGDQDYTTVFPFLYSTNGGGNYSYNEHNFNLQSDLTLKMKSLITFETGINIDYTFFHNNADYFTASNNTKEQDISRTNRYNYTQNINAAYLQLSKTFFKDAILKGGLRMENTNMHGQQTVPSDTFFNVHRTDLFPYVYLSKNLFKMLGVELRGYLVYRRSVSRPAFQQLNPFPKYVDQFLTEAGNPGLRPQFTNTYEANVCVNEYPVFAIGMNDKKDMITNVYYQDGAANNQGLRTFENIGRNREFYLRGVAGIPPGRGNYFFIAGAQYNYNSYEGFYQNAPIHFTGDNWMLFTFHRLRIGEKSQISLHGFWRFKGPVQLMEVGNIGWLNMSVNRQFLNKKLTATISVEDIFYTNNSTFAFQQGGVNVDGKRYTDSRRLSVNLRYNFGIRKKEEPEKGFDLPMPMQP